MNGEWDSNLFDSHDYEELDGLLADLPNEEGLRIDGAQGLLTALAVGPAPIATEDWLPLVLGEDPELLAFDGVEQLVMMLQRLQANVEQGLEHFAYEPVFMQHEDDGGEAEIDPGGWCEGFSIGVDLLSEQWERQLQIDPALLELLAPIMRLGVDAGVFEAIRRVDLPPLDEDEREHILRTLPARLLDLRQYWDEHGERDYATPASLH